MTEENLIVNIVAQYVTNLYTDSFVLPYVNKSPLKIEVSGDLKVSTLPEENHYKLNISVDITGINQEDDICFKTGCAVEAIVFSNLKPEDSVQYIETNIAGLVFGNIRAHITNASIATGYGPTILPPVTSDRIKGLLTSSN